MGCELNLSTSSSYQKLFTMFTMLFSLYHLSKLKFFIRKRFCYITKIGRYFLDILRVGSWAQFKREISVSIGSAHYFVIPVNCIVLLYFLFYTKSYAECYIIFNTSYPCPLGKLLQVVKSSFIPPLSAHVFSINFFVSYN